MPTAETGPRNPTSAMRAYVVSPGSMPGSFTNYGASPRVQSTTPAVTQVPVTEAPSRDPLARWRMMWKRKGEHVTMRAPTGDGTPSQQAPSPNATPAGGNIGAFVTQNSDHSTWGSTLWPPPFRIPRVVPLMARQLAGPSSIDGSNQNMHNLYVPNAYQTRVPRTSYGYRRFPNRNRSGQRSGLLHFWSPKIQPDAH